MVGNIVIGIYLVVAAIVSIWYWRSLSKDGESLEVVAKSYGLSELAAILVSLLVTFEIGINWPLILIVIIVNVFTNTEENCLEEK